MEVAKTFQTLTNPGDLQALYGPAYASGIKTYGINAITVRPVPISRLVDGKAEFVQDERHNHPVGSSEGDRKIAARRFHGSQARLAERTEAPSRSFCRAAVTSANSRE